MKSPAGCACHKGEKKNRARLLRRRAQQGGLNLHFGLEPEPHTNLHGQRWTRVVAGQVFAGGVFDKEEVRVRGREYFTRLLVDPRVTVDSRGRQRVLLRKRNVLELEHVEDLE